MFTTYPAAPYDLQLVVDDSVALTPFCLLLGKHRQAQRNEQDPLCEQVAARTQLPLRSTAVREVPVLFFYFYIFFNRDIDVFKLVLGVGQAC